VTVPSLVALGGDRIVCTCTHLQPHKPHAPVPMELVAPVQSGVVDGVRVSGRPVAVVGSEGLNRPKHRCRDRPDNIGRIEHGSTSVRVDERSLARVGDACSSCNVDGRRITGAVVPSGQRHVAVGADPVHPAALFPEPLTLRSSAPPRLREWSRSPAGVCASMSFESPRVRLVGWMYELTITISGEVGLSPGGDGKCLVGTSWARGKDPILEAYVRDMQSEYYSVTRVTRTGAELAVGLFRGTVELGMRLERPPWWWTHAAPLPTIFARFPLTLPSDERRITSELTCELTLRPSYWRLQLATVAVVAGVVLFIYGGEVVAVGALVGSRAVLARVLAATHRLALPVAGVSIIALVKAQLDEVAGALHRSLCAPITSA
jgi:uncharacterized Zn-binding protein involved in type VI secretion